MLSAMWASVTWDELNAVVSIAAQYSEAEPGRERGILARLRSKAGTLTCCNCCRRDTAPVLSTVKALTTLVGTLTNLVAGKPYPLALDCLGRIARVGVQ